MTLLRSHSLFGSFVALTLCGAVGGGCLKGGTDGDGATPANGDGGIPSTGSYTPPEATDDTGTDSTGGDDDESGICGSAYADCDGKSANGCESEIKSDPKNCGSCGNGCGKDEVCSGGLCGGACEKGLNNCFRACVDLATSKSNCGSCGNECAVGETCTSGKCAGCNATETELTRSPLYMEIVADASGSMTGDKWAAQSAALIQVISEFAAEADTKLGVGLVVFGDAGVTYPRKGKDVSINFVDAVQKTALTALVTASGPTGSTPTKEALTGAYSYLKTFSPVSPLSTGGQKLVLLLSDGAPNDDTGIETMVTDAAALASPEGPIRTSSIGVDLYSSSEVSFMSMVATRGGTAPSGCLPMSDDPKTACFFPVGVTATGLKDTFVATIHRARHNVACEYALAGTSIASDPTHATVRIVDGAATTSVAADPVDGWSLDDAVAPKKIILRGAACKTALHAKVNVSLACK